MSTMDVTNYIRQTIQARQTRVRNLLVKPNTPAQPEPEQPATPRIPRGNAGAGTGSPVPTSYTMNDAIRDAWLGRVRRWDSR